MNDFSPPQKNKLRILIAQYENRYGVSLSYRDLEERTGVPINTISSYVNQSAVRYDMTKVNALMVFFGIRSYDDFFIWEDDEEGNQKASQHLQEHELEAVM